MIVLKFDASRPTDPRLVCGWEAERQVAHDLGRAFADAPDVLVFHGLRFRAPRSASENDHAQIDHLLLHRHGMLLIESKGTGGGKGEFHIDESDQWTRCPTTGRRYNMESPVVQAKKQAESLRILMQAADPPLLDKVAGVLQERFGHFPILPLVAIANTARVSGPGARAHEGTVMKTEKVVERVREEIQSHRRASGVIGMFREKRADHGLYNLSDAARQRIADYLRQVHRPLSVPSPPAPPSTAAQPQAVPSPRVDPPPHLSPERTYRPAPAATAPVAATATVPRTTAPATIPGIAGHVCRHCGSAAVAEVRWGKRAYYAVCGVCEKGTDLDTTCTVCATRARIRKAGPKFYRECLPPEGCGATALVWAGG
jgi:hypothetical protein